ncbi:anti-sigma factor [Chloroflexia bacterium SDU3-3]|nr:anti-sigma factor [Chloroflexia bacterium SDU3-3]
MPSTRFSIGNGPMNTHPTEFIPGYVLGVLDDRERQVVARHLALCPQCRHEAESFLRSVAGHAGAPLAGPPHALKRRLMRRVRASLLRRRGGLALLAVALVVALGVPAGQRYLAHAHAQQQAATFMGDLRTLRHTLPAQGGMQATLYTQPGQRQALLQVAGMPPLAAGQVYQIWFAQGDTPVASASFTVDASGAAMVLCAAPAPIAETYTQLMVTLEPAGASAAPSGQPILAAPLAAGPRLPSPIGLRAAPHGLAKQTRG